MPTTRKKAAPRKPQTPGPAASGEPGTDLASREADVEQFIKLMDGSVDLAATGEDAAVAIVLRILKSQPDEDPFAMRAQGTPAKSILGVPLVLRDVHLNTSTYEEGPAVYAVLDAVRQDTGEILTVTCGSRNVLAQLFKAKRDGQLAGAVVTFATTEKPTAAGFYPLWLERANGGA